MRTARLIIGDQVIIIDPAGRATVSNTVQQISQAAKLYETDKAAAILILKKIPTRFKKLPAEHIARDVVKYNAREISRVVPQGV